MIVIILLIVVAIVAFGLYATVWHPRDSAKFNRIHAAALQSYSTDEPIDVQGVSTGAVSQFFSAYGTTQKKYQAITFPLVLYAGYVKLGDQEVVVVAIYHGGIMTITTHEPPHAFRDEEKMAFLQSVVEFFKTEARQAKRA